MLNKIILIGRLTRDKLGKEIEITGADMPF